VEVSADETVRRGTIGDYSELWGSTQTQPVQQPAAAEPEQFSGQTHDTQPTPNVVPAQSAVRTSNTAAVTAAKQPPSTGLAAAAVQPAHFLNHDEQDLTTALQIVSQREAGLTAEDSVLPTAPRLVPFRTADPGLLFTVSEEAPVFRAQSPEDEGGSDVAAPTREDQMINESPFRNQFQAIPPGWVDINVNATEGRTGRLMFGAGVNSNSGLVGNFVWDESNFDLFRPPTTFADVLEGRAWRGGGQRFRAEAAPGNMVSRYALTWTDPYFMYTDYSLSVGGFYFNRFYSEWTEDRVGGRVSVGRQFTPEWSGALALRLEDIEMRNLRAPVPSVVLPWVGHNFLSTGRISVTHDTRDSAMLPTEGHYFDVGYEQAFNEFNYPKVDTEFRQYFTLHSRPDGSGSQVLTLAGALGWAGDDTPVFERYFAGGFQSFRGFRFRGVAPRDATGFSLGGTFQALGTVEYRLPLTADDMISAVAFSDFGTVDDEVTLSEFRATAGFGLRLTIPQMGPVPLAFDFAFPITTQPADREQIFSFYVGINR
jgi:outer membrane protein insertion porin family